MKERPILFSGPMVRAILDGRKTMTRRTRGLDKININPNQWKLDALLPDGTAVFNFKNGYEIVKIKCPFGQPGDRLFVKEKFSVCYHEENFADIIYAADRERQTFPITGWIVNAIEQHGEYLRPSIHMPKWASRITLEIINVRVERVKKITLEDAYRAGFLGSYSKDEEGMKHKLMSPIEDFAITWDSLNAKKGFGWDANLFCWVIEFRRQMP